MISTLELTRRRLALLLDGNMPAAASAPPIVTAVAIDGRVPAAHQVQAIEAELRKVPPKVLADFRKRGGRVDVVCGNAARHRSYCGVNGHRQVDGFCQPDTPLIVVSATGDCPEKSLLHELGHFVDRGFRLSDSYEWQLIYAGAKTWSLAGPRLHNAQRDEAEGFAEGFMLYCHSTETRASLSQQLRQFVERAIR